MPGKAIRIVGIDVKEDKLFDVLVQNIGDSALDRFSADSWAICIKREDGNIVSPSVTSLSGLYCLGRNEILRIYVDPTRLYLQSGTAKITVSGQKVYLRPIR
jgi:hypothetical protein